MTTKIGFKVLALSSLFFSTTVLAEWTLSTQSSVEFVTTKSISTSEVNHFNQLSGSISEQGQANILIDLNSVETFIPVRNERLRGLLFNTKKFPQAQITASLPESVLKKAKQQAFIQTEVSVTLNLHGRSESVDAQLNIAQLSNGQLLVTTRDPIILSAEEFGMTAGIKTLKTLARLDSISDSVPVNLTLLFDQQVPASAP